MILAYKEHFPWGGPTYFEEKIKQGAGIVVPDTPTMMVKLHTIRGENCRIQPGTALHMAYGVRSKKYRQFNTGIEPLAVCKGRQDVYINCFMKPLFWKQKDCFAIDKERVIEIQVGGKVLSKYKISCLVENDGLTFSEFAKWFFPYKLGIFRGCIIHWTDLKY